MILAFIIVGLLLVSFGLIVFRGAPYVPTHPGVVGRALALAPAGGTLVDLGSGDGTMLVAAAKQGRRVHGIELNPFLVFVAWLRIRRYGRIASVSFGDFWQQRLPQDTSAVFVFLAGPFMAKLERHMQAQADILQREIALVSYGFEITGREPSVRDGPLLLYRFVPTPLQTEATLIP